MPEGLSTPDGTAVNVAPAGEEQGFAELMAGRAAEADGQPAEVPAPPKKDPEAPYGRRMDGTPKKAPGGRPPKAEKPRVEKPKGAVAAKDYTQPLTDLVTLAWGVLAPTSPADAAAVKMSGPGMVSAWNALAQENAGVAHGIEWLTSGSTYGAVVMATAPLVLQVMANHGRIAPERVAALGVRSPAELAEITAADVQAMAQAQAAA